MPPAVKLSKLSSLAVAVVIIIFLGTGTLVSCSAENGEGTDMFFAKVNAPELVGGLDWLNTNKAITLKELKGKIVLLDFWTFCCINCMHVIPDLKRLEAKYPNELVVIGVHSAKFENEKDTKSIKDAIMRYGIKHPVVNDANFAIWRSYGIRAWPTLVLIDPSGRIVAQMSGEGHLEELDQAIGGLIKEFDLPNKTNVKPLAQLVEQDKVPKTPLSFPGKILTDPGKGRLFISDSGHNRIVVTTPDGKLLDVIGSGQEGHQNGSFASSSFSHPQGLALKDNQLFVADTENHLIRRIDLITKTVHTYAGTGYKTASFSWGGNLSSTALSSPWDLVWVNEKLYIAMAGLHQLWVLDPKSNTIERYAGSGREEITDGPLKLAALAQPSGITSDGTNLYFVDSETSSVRSVDLSPRGLVKTIVGQGLFEFGDKDDTGPKARLQHPLGILWFDGKLLIADSYNHKIKEIDPQTQVARTLFGIRKSGFANGKAPQFNEPNGLAQLRGRLYIADTNNHLIRLANLKTGEVSTLTIEGLSIP